MCETFLGIFNSIPAQFWGMIVGAIFALTGIHLTNRANDKRLKTQFDHELRIKTSERELSIKKDVYLEATEAVSLGLQMLMEVANPAIPIEALGKSYLEKSSALNKAQLIADKDLFSAIINFSNELGKSYLQLLPKRLPLLENKQRIDLLNEQFTTAGSERDKMVELMKQYNLEGLNDPARWDVIQSSFEREQELVRKALDEHELLVEGQKQHYATLTTECYQAQRHVNQFVVPLLLASRIELKIPTDESNLIELMGEVSNQQNDYIGEFVGKVLGQPNNNSDSPLSN